MIAITKHETHSYYVIILTFSPVILGVNFWDGEMDVNKWNMKNKLMVQRIKSNIAKHKEW